MDTFVTKIEIKNKELDVPVLNDIGHGHSCLGEITKAGDDTDISNITKNKESSYMVEKPSMYGINNNEMVSIASANNRSSNNTYGSL